MSEQKLVSPLLDGFMMGQPIGSHDGVRCCPAIREKSDKKYFVKILSVPSSQKQLDALLLTGAYKDAAAALEYFRELADGVVQEAQLLQELSRLEGFLPCEGWQIVPMEDNSLGYEVYLLSPYRLSLEKHMKSSVMSHLGAVNMGLDLCAALASCRRAGYLYVDLKPSNIFITDDKEYRIGDVGFISLDSIKYAALPNKYRSCYSAPELHDDFATISDTADIYALGLILYQVYNDGQLPFDSQPPAEMLPPPANADYEIAEIILKACHPDPAQRWQDPAQMGQALVSYMQRNVINDNPIIPPSIDLLTDEENTDAGENLEAHEDLAFMNDMVSDETAPDADGADDLDDTELTEEASSMLAQAEELAAHEVPEPVVVPAPAEVSMPSLFPDTTDEQSAEDNADIAAVIAGRNVDDKVNLYHRDDEEDDEEDEDDDHIFMPQLPQKPRKKIGRGVIAGFIIIVLLALACGAGYYYYDNYYILPVESINLDGSYNQITAVITSDIDDSKLTAICTDTYGNTLTSAVQDGKAVFSDLKSGTQYTVTLKVEGFHKLQGSTTGTYTTAQQTNIVSFTAITGPEDGSVILNFTVEGPDPQEWVVAYGTEGEETQTVAFTGHMVTITGLTPNSVYSFRLLPAPETELYIAGTDTLEFTASKIIIAQNLRIVSCVGGALTAQWEAPAGAEVAQWSVRCYSNSDDSYDATTTVSDTTVEFTGIEANKSYTVEVLASGMTQSARTDISADPITVSGITGTAVDGSTLRVTWDYEGTAPTDGWMLTYAIDGGEALEVLRCEENSKDITMLVPNATYDITIQAADGSTVFGGTGSVTTAAAETFYEHSLHARHLEASLCVTPAAEDWNQKDVASYTTTFAPGESVSMVIYSSVSFYFHNDDTTILFVIRDADGNVRSDLLAAQEQNWKEMWNNRHCCLTIPKLPTEAGSYSVEIYFNGGHVITKNFTIAE